MFARIVVAPLLCALSACAFTPAPQFEVGEPLIFGEQKAFLDSCEDWDEWDKPAPTFHIYGNTYYVGTCGISAILVTDDNGHTLIDTGTDDGAKVVLANIAALGIDPKSISTILMSHEHYDHIGGIARVQAATGADIVATAKAANVLRSGLPEDDDPQHGSEHPQFPPVTTPIDVIDEFTALHSKAWKFAPIFTPGHTPGALSWQWRSCDADGGCVTIVYADSLSPVSSDAYRFTEHPQYIAEYREGLQRLREVECDLLLTPHPSASDMLSRMKSGTLVGGLSCRDYADRVEQRLDERLAKERSQ